MGRKRANIDVEKRIKKGYGRGRGKDYRPWLPVQAFSSRGYASRVPGWKTGREHHLLSNLELDFFYIADLAGPGVDIREQHPLLPVEETVAIATALGIRHPVYPKTKAPAVLTTDFLITLAGDPHALAVVESEIPEKHLRRRDRAWALIFPIAELDNGGMFDESMRYHAIVKICTEQKVPEVSLYRYLRRFWKRGQTKNALLPDYKNTRRMSSSTPGMSIEKCHIILGATSTPQLGRCRHPEGSAGRTRRSAEFHRTRIYVQRPQTEFPGNCDGSRRNARYQIARCCASTQRG